MNAGAPTHAPTHAPTPQHAPTQRAPLHEAPASGASSRAPSLEAGKAALRFACDVAADKVGQVGFDGLGCRHGAHVIRAR